VAASGAGAAAGDAGDWFSQLPLRFSIASLTKWRYNNLRCRRIAGLSGFFTLIQSRDGPDR
jgi:hypothetical protein